MTRDYCGGTNLRRVNLGLVGGLNRRGTGCNTLLCNDATVLIVQQATDSISKATPHSAIAMLLNRIGGFAGIFACIVPPPSYGFVILILAALPGFSHQ
jgi:hypothetical protein